MHRPLKAIVVEDDPTLCRLFAEVLTGDPAVEAVQANTLAVGVALAAAERHLVFLVDLGLPDASGTEAIARLRQTIPGATMVVVTGSADMTDAALEAGAHAVIVKGSPQSHGDELVRTVRGAVINHENEQFFRGASRALDRQRGKLDAAGRLLPTLLVGLGILMGWARDRRLEVEHLRRDNELRALVVSGAEDRAGSWSPSR